MVEEARTPRKANPGKRHPATSRALGDGTGTWRCCGCGSQKMVKDFYVTTGGKVCSLCTRCERARKAAYRRTLRGNAIVLVNSARTRSKLKGWICNLDVDFILDQILRQQGRCAYSGVKMEMLLPHSDWRMSLERLDNSLGYVQENCVLIAAEFNTPGTISKWVALNEKSGSSQWSQEKVEKLPFERSLNVDLQNLNKQIKAARLPNQRLLIADLRKPLEEKPSTGQHLQWPRCGCFNHPNCDALNQTRTGGLQYYRKERRLSYRIAYRMTLRGHIVDLLANARSRHRRGKWFGDFELELDAVLDMLWSQQGRCFYSDVPLRFAQFNVDWMMSLERLNNDKTYTMENTVLVALEFNTSDHSKNKASSRVFGTAQWSRGKVEHLWGCLSRHASTEAISKKLPIHQLQGSSPSSPLVSQKQTPFRVHSLQNL